MINEDILPAEEFLKDLGRDEIISQSVKVRQPKVSGVYFLINREKIIYIGSSLDVFTRIKHHRKNKRLKFDRYFIYKLYGCSYKSREEKKNRFALDVAEKYLIEKFKPLYNFQHNPDYYNGKKVLLSLFKKNFDSYYDFKKKAGLKQISVTTIRSVIVNGENHTKQQREIVAKALNTPLKQ